MDPRLRFSYIWNKFPYLLATVAPNLVINAESFASKPLHTPVFP
jgi:hypothetical protein